MRSIEYEYLRGQCIALRMFIILLLRGKSQREIESISEELVSMSSELPRELTALQRDHGLREGIISSHEILGEIQNGKEGLFKCISDELLS